MLAIAGCDGTMDGSGPGGGSANDQTDPCVGFTTSGKAVCETLARNHAASRGTLWNASATNALAGEWLIQTPPAAAWGTDPTPVPRFCSSHSDCAQGQQCTTLNRCTCATSADCGTGGQCRPFGATVTFPGQVPTNLCAGHSDFVLERMHRLIIDTEQHLELTSLGYDSSFQAAIINGLKHLNRKMAAAPGTVDVRILVAANASWGYQLQPYLDAFAMGVRADIASGGVSGWNIRLAVASIGTPTLLAAWNHAKLLIRDGSEVMSGGHFMSNDQLKADPIADVSMTLTGAGAAQAQAFVNALWRLPCQTMTPHALLMEPAGVSNDTRCLPWTPPVFDGITVTPVISVATSGSLDLVSGAWGYTKDIAGDDALYAMVDAARSTIYVSQQRITGLLEAGADDAHSGALFDGLGRALARGVEVFVVVTEDVPHQSDILLQHLRDMRLSPPAGYATWDALVCAKLHVAPFSRKTGSPLPSGGSDGFKNHSKFLMIDRGLFYIGSQNLYPGDLSDSAPAGIALADHGFIVDSGGHANQVLSQYWDPLWERAKTRQVPLCGDPCAAWSASCATCTPHPGCGWCDTACRSGTSAGPASGTCGRWTWLSSLCAQ